DCPNIGALGLRNNSIWTYKVVTENGDAPMTTQTAIAYIRVSSQQQGRSGLGLAAQRDAIERFAAAEDIAIVEWFEEVETGKGADALERRPQLAAALT